MELVVYSLLGLEYKIVSKDTLSHPVHGEIWAGTPDLKIESAAERLVAEIKCYEKKKFAQYTDFLNKPLTDIYTLEDKLTEFAKDWPAEYWQIVSNAHILGMTEGEAIPFMPSLDMAKEVQDMAADYEGPDQWKYRFIYESDPADLNFLPEGGHYKPLNFFRFEIPQADLDLCEERVTMAGALITNFKLYN